LTAILDASVAGKYLVPEADSDKAQALIRDWEQGKTELKAPQILPAEVASLLRKRILKGLLPASVATELFLRFEALRVPLEPIDDLTAPALALALRYGRK
jgi:predicted nucleic acid-binding protein